MTAPAAFSVPAPCVRTSYRAPDASVNGNALRWSIAFTALGAGANPKLLLEASIISATAPLTTPVAMLVPLSARYFWLLDAITRCFSGRAAKSA